MKKFLIVIIALSLMGCATVPYDYSQDDRYPPGKTDVEWVAEEKECRDMSGKITGILGLTPIGIAINLNGANEKYDKCMREKGWLK